MRELSFAEARAAGLPARVELAEYRDPPISASLRRCRRTCHLGASLVCRHHPSHAREGLAAQARLPLLVLSDGQGGPAVKGSFTASAEKEGRSPPT